MAKHSSLFSLKIMVSLPLSLLIVFLLSAVADGVDSSEHRKLFSLHNIQWRQHHHAGDSSCRSHQKTRTKEGITILEMQHRDYCSKKIIDWSKYQQKILIQDELHVRYLQSRMKTTGSADVKGVSGTEIPLNSGVKLQTLNYIATVELGGEKMTMIVDTGSDLTWVQCQPCKSCYNQKDPIFNPSTSKSYHKVLCNSSSCQSLKLATGNYGQCSIDEPVSCHYHVSYGDGSYTRGELGSERLILGNVSINDFVFGCGRTNKGLFGGASGLMGLGRSNLSLVSQTSSIFKGVFSYCLPSTENGTSGSLTLGDSFSVYKNSTPFTYTKIVSNIQLPTFYFLNLTGISIGGVRLEASGFSKGGILIDSGTVISRLPPSIYKAVKTEFVKQFSGFPTAPGYSILDTCFNLSSYKEVDIPIIKMQFEGNAEMVVDVTGVFYFVKTDASQVCLALASLSYEDEIGIIGNVQQRNQRVLYDTKNSMLGFAAESCSSSI